MNRTNLFRKLNFVALAFEAFLITEGQSQPWQFFEADFVAVRETTFEDVSPPGDILAGRFVDETGFNQGFLFNRVTTNWTSLSYPDAAGTIVYGISGNNLAGEYQVVNVVGGVTSSSYHGFYSTNGGTTLLPFSLPSQQTGSAIPGGVVGSKILGAYFSNGVSTQGAGTFYDRPRGAQGFVFDLVTQQDEVFSIGTSDIINSPDYPPGAVVSVEAFSLLGSAQVVGQAITTDLSGDFSYGFIRDRISGSTSLLNYSEQINESTTAHFGTAFYGASGNRIVGTGYGFGDQGDQLKGLLYDTQSGAWTVLAADGAVNTWAFSIEGNEVFGAAYFDDPEINGDEKLRAFVYTVPEPNSLGLLGFGFASLWAIRRRRYEGLGANKLKSRAGQE